ncbi:uncharacterized protein LOC126559482 [Anopheles maculipalpis]|uniref:uncharacterized protein LOC126559482 n=1 Tax=Anopheles maculipalpis TaxID=1496333 RepID=UPI0021597845|nr:uncharacterized protein LOC126559482 [Anopheles maculipalpis]
MVHKSDLVVIVLVFAVSFNNAAGRSLDRPRREVVTDGIEVELSTSGEQNRAAIPVISDIQRVEKIADLLISIGEHVIPALLDGLAEQVTAAAPERRFLHHVDKTSPEQTL